VLKKPISAFGSPPPKLRARTASGDRAECPLAKRLGRAVVNR
jgi:hypothetical protein